MSLLPSRLYGVSERAESVKVLADAHCLAEKCLITLYSAYIILHMMQARASSLITIQGLGAYILSCCVKMLRHAGGQVSTHKKLFECSIVQHAIGLPKLIAEGRSTDSCYVPSIASFCYRSDDVCCVSRVISSVMVSWSASSSGTA